MAHGKVSAIIPAPRHVVFDLLHDYTRRLEWDTLLQAAYLADGYAVAEKGATAVCVGRKSLGSLTLKTVYVSFERPRVAAVKMVNSPPFFQSWAASIQHEELSASESRLTYTFHFTARPHYLRFALEPIMARVFAWETNRRLHALQAFFRRNRQWHEAAATADNGPHENFGCERCWPPDADAAWAARKGLAHEAELIDSSHFHVTIVACPNCRQRFVSVFTETIDWEGGEDPQYWQILPITEAEAATLVQHGAALTETDLDALGPGRRCLKRDYPRAAAPRVFWGNGIHIGPHD
ncbi:MAG: SRPBCC family protein [Chloroflexaceae bacterium]|jgi:hypothetical protein|nr:SRPBCC family protein [Chloroflexaceae bacterium]